MKTRRLRKSPRNDPQQEKAYAWEGDFCDWAGAHATRAAMRKAVLECCSIYRVPAPEVWFRAKNRGARGRKLTSYYQPGSHIIVIRPRHMNLNTAVHEASHAVVDWILGWSSTQPHGPEWVGVFITLLDRMKIAPRAGLEAHARSMRLKFCSEGIVAPGKIRVRFRGKVRAAKRERRMLRL